MRAEANNEIALGNNKEFDFYFEKNCKPLEDIKHLNHMSRT